MSAKHPVSAAQRLRQSGLISREDLERAERLAVEENVGIEHASMSLGLLSEEQVLYLVAQTHGVDLVFPSASNVDAELLARFPLELLRRQAAVPLIVEDGHAVIAFAEMPSRETLEEFAHHAGVRVRAVLASARRLQHTLDQLLGSGAVDAMQSSARDLTGMTVFYRHLTAAFAAGADELRFEPSKKELRVRVRKDGVLYDEAVEPAAAGTGVATQARLLANLPPGNTSQMGDLVAQFARREVPLRLVIIATSAGELVVLSRRDVFSRDLELESCGLPEAVVDWLRGPFCAPAGTPGAAAGLLLIAARERGLLTSFVRAVLARIDPANAIAMVTRDVRLEHAGRVRVAPADDVAETVHALRASHPDVLFVDGGQALRGAAEAIYTALDGTRVLFGIIDPNPGEAVRDLLRSEPPPSRLHRALAGIVLLDDCRSLCRNCSRDDPDPQGWEGARVPVGCDACDGRGFDGTEIVAAGACAGAGSLVVAGEASGVPGLEGIVPARLSELVATGRVAKADAFSRLAFLESR